MALGLIFSIAVYGQQSEWQRTIISRYEEGKQLYDQQLYSPAAEIFRDVMVSIADEKSELYESSEYYRAMSSVHLMKKDAEFLVEEFLNHHPTSARRSEAIWTTADLFFDRKKYKDALEWLGKLDVRSLNATEKETFYFKVGYCNFMNGDKEVAKSNFNEIKDGSGTLAPSAKYYYAHIAYTDSNYVTALKNFLPLKDDEMFGPIVPYYLAQIYYQTGDDDKLLEVGQSLLKEATAKRAPEIAKLVGQALYRQKKYKEALPYMEMYKEKGGKMTSTDHYQLGVVYHSVGDFEKASESLNKITSGKSALSQAAYYLLADCYLKSDKKESAMSAFKAASEGDDDIINENALFNYAKLSYELANPFEDAIRAMRNFLKAYPNSQFKSEANAYLANLYLTTKDYDNALVAIKESGLGSMHMREAYQKVSYFRGVELYNSAQWGDALNMFIQSMSYPINQTYVALCHYWIGEIKFRQKDLEGALVSYNDFQQVPGSYNLSEFSLSQYNKAYCYFGLEKYNEASTAFRLFIENKKADAKRKEDSKLRIADSYFMVAKYAQAVDYYEAYLKEKGRESDYATFQNALCLGLINKNDKKIAELKKLELQYPASKFAVDGAYELASTLFKLDRNNEALDAFTKFKKQYPNSVYTRRAILNIGVIQRNLGNYSQAITEFKTIVEKYPATQEANEAISFARLTYDQMNRIEEYLDWIQGIGFADVKRASLDSTVYSSAYDKYGMGNCADAIVAFETYLKRFPDGFFVVESNYYTAECLYEAKDYSKAEQAYKQVTLAPKGRFSEKSWLRVGIISMQKENWEAASDAFEQLISISEDVSMYRQANAGLMKASYKLERLRKAVQFAEIVIADEKIAPEVRNEAYLIKARSLWKLEEFNSAFTAFTDLKENSQGEPKAEACYYLAKYFNMNGQYEKSSEEIFWMIDNLPAYKNWSYKALLVLSDNYWKLEDIFQANYTLDFIISDNFNEETVQAAKQLKDEIRRAQEDKAKKKEEEAGGDIEIDLENSGKNDMNASEEEEGNQ